MAQDAAKEANELTSAASVVDGLSPSSNKRPKQETKGDGNEKADRSGPMGADSSVNQSLNALSTCDITGNQ